MLDIIFVGKVWNPQVILRWCDGDIESINIVENVIYDSGRLIETKSERFVGLLVLFLDDGRHDVTHVDFRFESFIVKIKRNSIVHQNDKVFVKFKNQFCQKGLVQTSKLDLKE